MKRLLVIGLLLWVSVTACTSACAAVTQDELGALKELQQTKLDAVKELHQKDVDALRQQVAAVDKRVDDQLAQVGQAVDRFSVQSAWTGILITVLLVFGGFLGYRNAKQEAKSDAKEAASDQGRATAEHWFELHTAALKARIAELEQKATQIHQGMDKHLADVREHATTSKEEIDQALATAQENIGTPLRKSTPTTEQSHRVLTQRDHELQNTPENSYSFEDWDTRAFAAVGDNRLEDAAYFWQKAAVIPNAGAKNVAYALFNKGVTQDQLNQPETAIATYNDLLNQFCNDTDPALSEVMAKALFNKGVIQSKLNKLEDSIATFDDLVQRFAKATEPALRVQLAYALNARGFSRLLSAKSLGLQNPSTHDLLLTAVADFELAIAKADPPSGILLGNRAYAHLLLGNTENAKLGFAEALRASERGGQMLYDATLKDLTVHPIPKDAAMRELVERAWAAYQQEQAAPPSSSASAPAPH